MAKRRLSDDQIAEIRKLYAHWRRRRRRGIFIYLSRLYNLSPKTVRRYVDAKYRKRMLVRERLNRQKFREKAVARVRKWQKAHPELVQKYNREYSARNREKIRERDRQYSARKSREKSRTYEAISCMQLAPP
jgi:hypothetical protein